MRLLVVKENFTEKFYLSKVSEEEYVSIKPIVELLPELNKKYEKYIEETSLDEWDGTYTKETQLAVDFFKENNIEEEVNKFIELIGFEFPVYDDYDYPDPDPDVKVYLLYIESINVAMILGDVEEVYKVEESNI